MEIDTMILMGLTAAAFFWWFCLKVQEDRRCTRELLEQEKDRKRRAERVKILTNRR